MVDIFVCANEFVCVPWEYALSVLGEKDFLGIDESIRRVYYWYARSLSEGRGAALLMSHKPLYFWTSLNHALSEPVFSGKVFGGFDSVESIERWVSADSWFFLKSLFMLAKEDEKKRSFK